MLKSIINSAIEAFNSNKLPLSVKSDNPDVDVRKYNKALRKEARSSEIGTSTERGRGLIWFYRRKHK